METLIRDDFLTTERSKRSKKVRIGITGGRFGAQFQWHLDPDCEVVAVADRTPGRREKLATTYECSETCETFEELITRDDIEAVAVFTGAPDHVEHAIAAMKHGKHVVSAVPAAQSLEGCERLAEAVRQTGMTYMLAETSYYRSPAITARMKYRDGEFGNIFYSMAEYKHPGIEELWKDESGGRTWRYGRPPMFQSSHCTAYVIGVTGERLSTVSCVGTQGTGDAYAHNMYDNPYANQFALFRTDRGNAHQVIRTWHGAHPHSERAEWYGDKMSFFMESPVGDPPYLVREGDRSGTDDAGFSTAEPVREQFEDEQWWSSELIPEAMRGGTGHGGSHTLLTHEFIDALMRDRTPAIDIEVALAMAAAACVANESSLQHGRQLEIPVYGR